MLLCPPFWLQPTDLEEAGAPGWVCRCHCILFILFFLFFFFWYVQMHAFCAFFFFPPAPQFDVGVCLFMFLRSVWKTHLLMWQIWVRVCPSPAAGAQLCTPAGVHGLCIYSPKELLTSPTACCKKKKGERGREKNQCVCVCVFLEEPWTWPGRERGDETGAEA